MGYFSNGTEGMLYEDDFCSRCVHQKPDDGGCAVWLAHMLYNYRDCNDENSILHLLIPRSKDKLSNEKCTMWTPLPERELLEREGQERLF